MNMRITVYDKHNWVIEEELPAGEVLKHGIAAGKVTKGGWRALGYYPSLEYAALAMLDKQASASVRSGANDILDAIRAAKTEVIAAMDALQQPLKGHVEAPPALHAEGDTR